MTVVTVARPRRLDRLVARYRLDPPLPVVWAGPTQRRRRGHAPPIPYPAAILDISISGALIVIYTATELVEVGTRALIARCGGTGTVVVRHSAVDHGQLVCGVEFVDVRRALPDLNEIVERCRPNRLQEVWDHSD